MGQGDENTSYEGVQQQKLTSSSENQDFTLIWEFCDIVRSEALNG